MSRPDADSREARASSDESQTGHDSRTLDPGGPFSPFARTSSRFSENGSASTVMGGGAKLHGARFTPKGSFSSIYLASDPITARMEIVSVFDHPNWARSSPPRAAPWTLFTVDGVVANLIDLADAETQELLGTNEQELSGIWLTVDKPVTLQTISQGSDAGATPFAGSGLEWNDAKGSFSGAASTRFIGPDSRALEI